jgi:2-methylisocitrate lyase-like PEP mutase family enzyme
MGMIEFEPTNDYSANIKVIGVGGGGGNAVNTYHNVRRFEAAGVAAVHIEDQVPGKLFGAGGTLHPGPIAVDKLRAALDARRDPNTLIIGRCEAVFIGRSQAEAEDRCHAYAETGVDMLLVTGLPLDDTPAFAEAMGKPMAGFILNDAWEAVAGSGLKLAIYPFQSVLIAYGAIREFLGDLRTTGSVGKFDWGSEERLELEKLLGFDAGADLAKRYKVI